MESTHTDERPAPLEWTAEQEEEEREIGVVLSERYLVLRRLGSGSTSTTYDVHDLAHNVRRALKVLHPFFATRPEAIERLQRQARAAALIGHPCIVEVTDLGQTEDGLPYIAMEYLDGESLERRLARSGPMHLGRAGDVLLQVLDALHAAHMAGVVHRDLRPENVLLVREGRDDCVVKLLDFGGASFDDSRIVAPDWEHGAASRARDPADAYAPPERSEGRSVDHRGDIFAAGVLLHEMLSGLRPYPASVAALVQRATDADPARRFLGAATMARAFAELLASQDDYISLRSLPSLGIARRQAATTPRVALASTVTAVGSSREPAWVSSLSGAARSRLVRPENRRPASSLLRRRALVATGIALFVFVFLLQTVLQGGPELIEDARLPAAALPPATTNVSYAPAGKPQRQAGRRLRRAKRRRDKSFLRGIHYGGPPAPASGTPAAPESGPFAPPMPPASPYPYPPR